MNNENNVEEISSLIEELLKDIKGLTSSRITIKGSFGTRVYNLIDRYNSNLNELSSYMDNSFVPAYQCMKRFQENKEVIDRYTKTKETIVKEFQEKTYNDFISAGKSESEARSLSYDASRRYRTNLENKIEMLRSENNTLRRQMDQLSDERLQTGEYKEYGIYSASKSEAHRLYGTPAKYSSDYESKLYKGKQSKQKIYRTEYGEYGVTKYKIQSDYGIAKYKIQSDYGVVPYKLKTKTESYKVQSDYGALPYKTQGEYTIQSDYGALPYKTQGEYKIQSDYGALPYRTQGEYIVQSDYGALPYKTQGEYTLQSDYGVVSYRASGNFFKKN